MSIRLNKNASIGWLVRCRLGKNLTCVLPRGCWCSQSSVPFGIQVKLMDRLTALQTHRPWDQPLRLRFYHFHTPVCGQPAWETDVHWSDGCDTRSCSLSRCHLLALAPDPPRLAPRMGSGRPPLLQQWLMWWERGWLRCRWRSRPSCSRAWRAWSIGGRACASGPPSLPTFLAPHGTLASLFAFDQGPHFVPTVVADGIAQGEHGIDVGIRPMHARAFQAVFDDQLIGALDHATTNGPAVRQKLRLPQLDNPLLQIREVLGQFRQLGVGGYERAEVGQHAIRSGGLEVVQHLGQARRIE